MNKYCFNKRSNMSVTIGVFFVCLYSSSHAIFINPFPFLF